MRKLICKKEISGTDIVAMISEHMIRNNKNMAQYSGKIFIEVETIIKKINENTPSFKDWTLIVEVFSEHD